MDPEPGPSINEEWWFSDGSILLQASKAGSEARRVLFKLHLSTLARASDLFKDLGNLPPREGEPAEGTEARPLFIHEVDADTFADLLQILYLQWGEPLTLPVARLVSVLRAAHRYQFASVCRIAESQLRGKMDAARELELARQVGSPEWGSAAFKALVLAHDDVPDLSCLDGAMEAKVRKARQQITACRLRHLIEASFQTTAYTYTPPGYPIASTENVEKICYSHFRILLQFVMTANRQTFAAKFRTTSDAPTPATFAPQSGFVCCSCVHGDEGVLESIAGPVAEEHRITEEVWQER